MRMTLTAARVGCAAFLALGLAGCSGPAAQGESGAVAQASAAQAGPGGIPLVKDLPPGYNMDGGLVLDMRGIALGMPRAEAFAKLQEYFPQGKSQHINSGLTGSDGYNRVSFPFDAEDTMESTIDGTRDIARFPTTHSSPVSMRS